MNNCILGVFVGKRERIVLAALLMLAQTAFGGIIPPDRRITWQGNVGIPGGIPKVTTIYTTLNAGATASQINAAIGACPSNQVVMLAAGNYSINSDIYLDKSGVVLRGAGVGQTTITLTANGAEVKFLGSGISDSAISVDANLSQDAVKDGNVLVLSSVPSWVTVGELIGIDQLDDASFVAGAGTSGGSSFREDFGNGARGLGEVNRVTAKTSTTITLETPLHYGYRTSQTAQIFQPHYNPSTSKCVQRCGIENLTLTSTQSGSAMMIRFEDAYNCWISNVEIPNQTGAYAVWPVFSYRLEMTKLNIKDSHLYGGGQGYGVAPWHLTSNCLIYDSIFQHLHNAMTCNYGASGNVFAYNYERDGFSTAGQNPAMNTHGVHAYMNLWEGNFTEDKLLTDWTHGSSSHNTLLRNRVTGDNGSSDDQLTCISIEYYNRFWNIIGNVLGTKGLHDHYAATSSGTCIGNLIYRLGGEININCDFSPSDSAAVSAYILHGNYDVVTSTNSGIVWNPTISDHTIPNSYYLASKPAWFGNRPWPPFDPASPLTAVATNIPAGYRFVFGVDPPTGPVNLPPVAVAGANPTSGSAPLTVTFSSTGSLDPEGTALTYNWTFGDGTPNSTAANPSHPYLADGTYVARLAVSDGTNTTTSADLTIRVGNQPPVAVASANPTSGFVPLAVAFSSAGSLDPEGTPLTYSWTFGDGATSTSANPSHTYQAVGSYSARLTVSDGVKTTSTSNLVVSVIDPASTLVAAYSFEEGTGAVAADASGHGNSGAISGATWTTGGRFGKALTFGSGALVTVNDSASLDLTTGMTLEAWAYPTALSGSWMSLICKLNGDPGSQNPCYVLQGSTPPGLVPSLFISSATGNLMAPSVLPLNTWSHVTATYDGATMRLYVNGVQVASQAQTGAMTTSIDALTIGGNAFSGGNWTGLIDEVRIYNRALSATEIQADMNTPVNGTAPAPPQNLRVVSP